MNFILTAIFVVIVVAIILYAKNAKSSSSK